MDKIEILEDLGLSQNDAKIYLALLDKGPMSVIMISRTSKVNRTNIYDCLKRLIEKGIVSYYEESGKKLYVAADPEILTSILKQKELQLNSILPELRLKSDFAKKKSEVHIFEGIVAVRNMLNHFVEKGETRYAYGFPINVSKLLGTYFLESYHRRRVKNKIDFKIIYNLEDKDRIDYLNDLSNTEVRYLAKEYQSQVTTNICGDEVVLFLYSEKPVTIQIKNEMVAKAYKNYFDLLWKKATKTN